MTDVNQNHQKMLLHACCGPCSLEPSRILRDRGHEISIYYANDNIDPGPEYEKRLRTLNDWALTQDFPVIPGCYDHGRWKDAVQQAAQMHPGQRQERCRACYRLRLEQTARFAAAQGFGAIATTLSVSPYQYTQVIAEELQRAAGQFGLTPVFDDFRPYYDEATRKSRELGMYRQNYCGCEISYAEAEREREERKAARQAQRAAYLAEHADERAQEEAARQANRREKQEYANKRARQRALLKELRQSAKSCE